MPQFAAQLSSNAALASRCQGVGLSDADLRTIAKCGGTHRTPPLMDAIGKVNSWMSGMFT